MKMRSKLNTTAYLTHLAQLTTNPVNLEPYVCRVKESFADFGGNQSSMTKLLKKEQNADNSKLATEKTTFFTTQSALPLGRASITTVEDICTIELPESTREFFLRLDGKTIAHIWGEISKFEFSAVDPIHGYKDVLLYYVWDNWSCKSTIDKTEYTCTYGDPVCITGEKIEWRDLLFIDKDA